MVSYYRPPIPQQAAEEIAGMAAWVMAMGAVFALMRQMVRGWLPPVGHGSQSLARLPQANIVSLGDPYSPDVIGRVADLAEKWSRARRNSTLALRDLEAIGHRYDISECREALLEYRDIERSDYSDPEEYQEARDEAWEAFLECLESLAGEEETESYLRGAPHDGRS